MSKVALVTDSTAYIPKELVNQYEITVTPQVLIWGEETFRDGVDIQPDEFYSRLLKSPTLPSTSQATPGAFIKIFTKLLEEGHEVLAVLISEKLSGTMCSALQALEQFPGAPIAVVDSTTTAMGMGFQVLAAARAAEQGATLAECKRLVEEARNHTGVFITLDTLEFLHRGGRIGGGARFLGTALNIKPILELRDGQLEAIERVRTRNRAMNRVVELVEEKIGGSKPVHLASLHANCEADACLILDKMNGNVEAVERLITTVSPVVGTHVGPGTVGIAYMAGF